MHISCARRMCSLSFPFCSHLPSFLPKCPEKWTSLMWSPERQRACSLSSDTAANWFDWGGGVGGGGGGGRWEVVGCRKILWTKPSLVTSMGTALRINHVGRGRYKRKTAACSRLKTDEARSGIPAQDRSNKRTATVSTQRKQTYTQQQRLTQGGRWSGCAIGRSCIFKCDVTWRRGLNPPTPPPPDCSDWAESKTTYHHFTSPFWRQKNLQMIGFWLLNIPRT